MSDPAERLVAELRAAGCVYAEEEAALLLESGPDGLEDRVARRVGGEPLELVLGWAEFAGLRIAVAPGVFVPRRRSVLLVQQAVLRLGAGSLILDLCCGTAAIGAAVASQVPDVTAYATDVDPRAVRCARRNLSGDRVFEGDLYAALPTRLRGTIDVVVANAPYVPDSEVAFMPREARMYEPSYALAGGPDGLDVQRRVAAGAGEWLCSGGALLIETSRRQASRTRDIMIRAGFDTEIVRSDDLDATAAVGIRV